MLSSKEVIKAEFPGGRRGQGYDEIEVDDYLDRVSAALAAHETGGVTADLLRSSDIDNASFSLAKGFGHKGYDAESVDLLLTKARETLRVYEAKGGNAADGSAGAGPGATPSREEPGAASVTSPSPTPSPIREAKPGFFSRLFGR